MKQTTTSRTVELSRILNAEKIQQLQGIVREVVAGEHVFQYAADLVRMTRPKESTAPAFVKELVAWGAGPRASQYLILAGKARALLQGRLHVTTQDIRAIACPVLRHRLLTTFLADAEGITTDAIIDQLLAALPLPQETAAKSARG